MYTLGMWIDWENVSSSNFDVGSFSARQVTPNHLKSTSNQKRYMSVYMYMAFFSIVKLIINHWFDALASRRFTSSMNFKTAWRKFHSLENFGKYRHKIALWIEKESQKAWDCVPPFCDYNSPLLNHWYILLYFMTLKHTQRPLMHIWKQSASYSIIIQRQTLSDLRSLFIYGPKYYMLKSKAPPKVRLAFNQAKTLIIPCIRMNTHWSCATDKNVHIHSIRINGH